MAGLELDRAGIEKILLHRNPFLFLARATIVEPGVRAKGKLPDLTKPEFAYLSGHFPGLLIVPGVLITEALAELSGIAASSSEVPELQDKVVVLTADYMKYRQKIFPAEATLIELEAEIIALRSNAGRARVRAMKKGQVAVEGKIHFMMADRSEWPQF